MKTELQRHVEIMLREMLRLLDSGEMQVKAAVCSVQIDRPVLDANSGITTPIVVHAAQRFDLKVEMVPH